MTPFNTDRSKLKALIASASTTTGREALSRIAYIMYNFVHKSYKYIIMPNEIMKHLEARGRTETPRTASREPMGEVIRKNSIIDLRLLISKAGERKEIAVPTGGWAGKTVPVKVPTDEAKAKYMKAISIKNLVKKLSSLGLESLENLYSKNNVPKTEQIGKQLLRDLALAYPFLTTFSRA